MRKLSIMVFVLLAILSVSFLMACSTADTGATSYAEDRALIEDLQARYLFALDFGDMDTYAKTFTEDGILDIVGFKWQGRENIKRELGAMSANMEKENPALEEGEKELYPATGRHNITNIVIKINGNRATGRAYWFHVGNDNPERKAVLNSYGYYEDEMEKVNGEWLFSKRIIYNEQMAEWIGSAKNPAW
ncbi:MAG: nuclear transport factor 2 family protein [Deltaproteobacteria bacterium]|nr:nuclear transport factor 2 family protein [Deltaproteobacteria bacterium]